MIDFNSIVDIASDEPIISQRVRLFNHVPSGKFGEQLQSNFNKKRSVFYRHPKEALILMVKKRNAGAKLTDLAKEYKCSTHSVLKVLARYKHEIN
jgi:hypothetical protein